MLAALGGWVRLWITAVAIFLQFSFCFHLWQVGISNKRYSKYGGTILIFSIFLDHGFKANVFPSLFPIFLFFLPEKQVIHSETWFKLFLTTGYV